MGINFPPSPTIGTLWPNPATAGVPQYTWNGTVWTTVLAPPAFYAQDTAPVGAPVNALWWDTDSGILFINYKDVSTTQWVATSSTPAVDTSGFATQTSRLRNRIVNGAMQISQEWGNTLHGPTASIGFWPADQWQSISTTSPGTASIQRVQSRTPKGSQDRIRIVVAAAKTTLTAGDYLILMQSIEGNHIADFVWGTAQAKQVILRFGFKGPAGTYSAIIKNGTSNRCYIANFTITAGQANTDTEQVITILGDTTGTWAINEATGVTLMITLATGSNFHGVLGWQAGNLFGTSATSNGMAATNNTFEIFDVGLYLDADNVGVPPKWELPAVDDELERCQRYYEKSYDTNNLPGTISTNGSLGIQVNYTVAGIYTLLQLAQFSVRKRVAPTIKTFSPSTGVVTVARDITSNTDVACYTYWAGEKGFVWATACSVAQSVAYFIAHYTASARM